MPPKKRARIEKETPPPKTKQTKPKTTSKPSPRAAPAPLNTPPTQRLDIYVFGTGDQGELGLGTLKRNGKKPRDVQRPRLNDLLDAEKVGVVQLDVGGMHSIALTHDNQIFTWGVNDNGALGRDTTWAAKERDVDDEESEDEDDDDAGFNPLESTPMAVPKESFGEGVRFAQVAATDSASFALTTDGTVWGWGTFRGPEGEIGFTESLAKEAEAKNRTQRTPILIQGLVNIKSLTAGGNHVLALSHTGNVYSWGSGTQFQLGRMVMDKYKEKALTPSQFGLPKKRIKALGSGTYNGFALDDRGKVYAWGLSNFGQTGIQKGAGDDNSVVKKPTIVKALEDLSIKDIQGGLHHSVAATEDGECLVWGRYDDSQAGILVENLGKDDLIFDDRGKPRILIKPTVVPDIKTASVAAGIDNSFAITKDGAVYSWGFSANYRTGLGTEDTIEEATKIENSAVKGKKITFAGCGGQFSVIAGPVASKK